MRHPGLFFAWCFPGPSFIIGAADNRLESLLLADIADPSANGEYGLAWLHFRSGEIRVKSPDQKFLAKMLSIAAGLNAIVVGDDGELYERPDDHGVLPAATLAPKPAPKPWWRFW